MVDILALESATSRVTRLVNSLCRNCIIHFVIPEERIITQGHRETDGMYLINDGFCKVHIFGRGEKSPKVEDHIVRILKRGDYFGEISLIHDSHRSASVTAQNYSILGKLTLPTLYNVLKNFPHFRKALLKETYLYNDALRIFTIKALSQIEYMKAAQYETISNLAFKMKTEVLESGSLIFKPGDESDCLFIV